MDAKRFFFLKDLLEFSTINNARIDEGRLVLVVVLVFKNIYQSLLLLLLSKRKFKEAFCLFLNDVTNIAKIVPLLSRMRYVKCRHKIFAPSPLRRDTIYERPNV